MSRLLFIGLLALSLAVLACGPSDTSDTAVITQPNPTADPSSDPSPQLPPTPMPFSQARVQLGQPLSSGLSIAEVVENALLSVVEIQTRGGNGTGFIVNEAGLVVTNSHVVAGQTSVGIRMTNGVIYQGNVTQVDLNLDLAYIEIDSARTFIPIAIGDSDAMRVGEDVIAIGFPLGTSLGTEPTVSVGIVSAKREGYLQTDASLNPGNSGGPLLDIFGQVCGVIVSRLETSDSGRPIAGIGFAIPINVVKANLGGAVSSAGQVLPTPTAFPTIEPTPDLEATRTAIEAVDAQRRLESQATRTAIEAQEEAERYAASLEATRVAQLPTATPVPTPTPEPTPTPAPPTPTPTPHPRTYCDEWEAMVLDWIKQGNNYYRYIGRDPSVPDHPRLSAKQAHSICIISFPLGRLVSDPVRSAPTVGAEESQLLPGVYEYRARDGGNRVTDRQCYLTLNMDSDDKSTVSLIYGQPFQFTLLSYHNAVRLAERDGNWLSSCGGDLYRIGS